MIKEEIFLKGIPYLCEVVKDKYWNKEIIIKGGTPSIEINMEQYPGITTSINYDYNIPLVHINSETLPFYADTKEEDICIAPYTDENGYYLRKDVFNILEGGEIIINEGIASNFGPSSYLKFQKTSPNTNQFTFISKIKIKDLTRHNIIMSEEGTGYQFSIRSTGKFCAYISGWVDGKTVLELDKWYWVKVERDDTANNYKYYLLADNGSYTVDTLPDNSQWSLELEDGRSFFSNNKQLRLGNNQKVSGEYMTGEIDLNNTLIIFDSIFFDNKKVPYYDVYLGSNKNTNYNYEEYTAELRANKISTQVFLQDIKSEDSVWCGNIKVNKHVSQYALNRLNFQSELAMPKGYIGGVLLNSESSLRYLLNNEANYDYKYFLKFKLLQECTPRIFFLGNPYDFQVGADARKLTLGGSPGGYDLTLNEWYWLQLRIENNNIILYEIMDNNYTVNTLPSDITLWTQVYRLTGTSFFNKSVYLGCDTAANRYSLSTPLVYSLQDAYVYRKPADGTDYSMYFQPLTEIV